MWAWNEADVRRRRGLSRMGSYVHAEFRLESQKRMSYAYHELIDEPY